MSRITFNSAAASDAATFSELFSDSGRATWYQLWTGTSDTFGEYVDTSAFSSYGDGWIREEDLDRLDTDFAQAGDTILYVRPWDGSSVNEAWEDGSVGFSYAASNYITTDIAEDTSMDRMFTDFDVANNTWYRLWIGNSEGSQGAFVDTGEVNEAGAGWVRPAELSELMFSLDDAGRDLWVQTWVGPTGVDSWEHWTVRQSVSVSDLTVSEADATATFTITLPELVADGDTLELAYETLQGTADPGDDYESASGTVTFQAGENEKEVQVDIIDDTVSGEESETFELRVSNSDNRVYSEESSGTCTIADNDDTGDGDPSVPEMQGTEFRVNSETSDNQKDPAVDAFTGGGFVTVWESENLDGSGYGIYGQLYDSDGDASGDEIAINIYTDNHQMSPDVVSLPGGGFVVAWQSLGRDGSGYGISGRIYDSQGSAEGDEFQINTRTEYNQSSPSITGLSGGGFVVTWHSAGQDGSGSGVYARQYDSEGEVLGDEFLVNTTVENNQSESSVFSLADGKYVVLWTSDSQDGSGKGVYGQMYAADGTVSGGELAVNTTTENDQKTGTGIGLADGGFVTVWASDGHDGGGDGIYGQRYDSSGTAIGNEFLVNTYTTANQEKPSVVSLADGGFAVIWESYGQDGSLEGVYGQLYDGSGNTVADEFLINTTTAGDQDDPDLASLHDLGFVTVWEGETSDRSSLDVYGQVFTADMTEYAGYSISDVQANGDLELMGVEGFDIDNVSEL